MWGLCGCGLYGKIILRGGAEGGASEHVQAVDEDEGAGQVLPSLGDGVLHTVQAQVQLLNHIAVAVPDLGRPCQQEVVRWLPHCLSGDTQGGWSTMISD